MTILLKKIAQACATLSLRGRINLAVVGLFGLASIFQISRFWIFINEYNTVYLFENRNLQTESAASSLSLVLYSLGQSIAVDPVNKFTDTSLLTDAERPPEGTEVFLQTEKTKRKLLITRSKEGELRAKSIDMAWLFRQIPVFSELQGVLMTQNARPIAYFGMSEAEARHGAVERFKELLKENTPRGETVRKDFLHQDLFVGHQIVAGTNLILYTEANLSDLLKPAFLQMQLEALSSLFSLLLILGLISLLFRSLTAPIQNLVDVFEMIGTGVRHPKWPKLLPEFGPMRHAVDQMNEAITDRQNEIEKISSALQDILKISQNSALTNRAQSSAMLEAMVLPLGKFMKQYFGRLFALEPLQLITQSHSKDARSQRGYLLTDTEGLRPMSQNDTAQACAAVQLFSLQEDGIFSTGPNRQNFCLNIGNKQWGKIIFVVFSWPFEEVSPLEHRILETFAHSLNKIFEGIYLDELHLEMSLAQSELASARDIQRASLVEPSTQFNESIQVQTVYEPCEQVGGDWYGVFYHPELNLLNVFIGDVSGHGLSSAFLASLVSGAIQSEEMNLKRSMGQAAMDSRFATIASRLNELVKTGSAARKSMSMCMASFDLESGMLTVLSAGHPRPLRLASDRRSASPLFVKQNNLFGYDWNAHYNCANYQLQPGDTILFFTDGLTESRSLAKDRQGTTGGKLSLRNLTHLVAELGDQENLARNLADYVKAKRKVDDDLALVTFTWNKKH